jgi:hypothetical protein
MARHLCHGVEYSCSTAVLVLTDHVALDWDLVKRRVTFIFDTRHRLTGPHVEHL